MHMTHSIKAADAIGRARDFARLIELAAADLPDRRDAAAFGAAVEALEESLSEALDHLKVVRGLSAASCEPQTGD
jgi:hypothetical protein